MGLDFLTILKIIEESRLDVFTTASLAKRLGVSSPSIQNYLETLSNNELIKRIEKGKYCRIYIDNDIPGEVFISSPLQKTAKRFLETRSALSGSDPIKNSGP